MQASAADSASLVQGRLDAVMRDLAQQRSRLEAVECQQQGAAADAAMASRPPSALGREFPAKQHGASSTFGGLTSGQCEPGTRSVQPTTGPPDTSADVTAPGEAGSPGGALSAILRRLSQLEDRVSAQLASLEQAAVSRQQGSRPASAAGSPTKLAGLVTATDSQYVQRCYSPAAYSDSTRQALRQQLSAAAATTAGLFVGTLHSLGADDGSPGSPCARRSRNRQSVEQQVAETHALISSIQDQSEFDWLAERLCLSCCSNDQQFAAGQLAVMCC